MKLEWLYRNISIKIVALLLALILWFYIENITGENPFMPKREIFKADVAAVYIPIEPRFRGALPRGYALDREKTRVIPENILIIGEREFTEQITKIYTVPINITGFTRTIELDIPLEVLGQKLNIEGSMVKVRVAVERVS